MFLIDYLKAFGEKLTSINNEQVYALLFLIALFFVFIVIFSPRNYKDKNDKYFLQDKEVNKAIKEEHWKQRTISGTIFFAAAALIYSNASYFFTVLSVFGAAAAFAIREELADIFSGILMRSRVLTTAVFVGQTITIPDKFGDNVFIVAQIKTFKTVLLNKKTSEYISVRNVSMIRENVKHIVIDKLITIKLFFIIDSRINTKKMMYDIDRIVVKEFANGEIYNQDLNFFKDIYTEIKTSFGAFPRVKNRYNVFFKYINKNEIGMDFYCVIGNVSNLDKNDLEQRLFHLINCEILKFSSKLPEGN